MTPAQIRKLPRKNMTVDQFLKLAARVSPGMGPLSRGKILKVGNGGFLGVYGNKGKFYRLHLKCIWITPITMKYSAHKNTRVGKEIIISSFPLPRGPIFKKKAKK